MFVDDYILQLKGASGTASRDYLPALFIGDALRQKLRKTLPGRFYNGVFLKEIVASEFPSGQLMIIENLEHLNRRKEMLLLKFIEDGNPAVILSYAWDSIPEVILSRMRFVFKEVRAHTKADYNPRLTVKALVENKGEENAQRDYVRCPSYYRAVHRIQLPKKLRERVLGFL